MPVIIYLVVAIVVAAIVCTTLNIEVDSPGGTVVILLCIFGIPAYAIIKGIAESIEKSKVAKEQQRVAQVKKDVENLINKYSAYITASSFLREKSPSINASHFNTSVIYCIGQLKESLNAVNAMIATEGMRISTILTCSNCHSDEDKLDYLRGHTTELDKCTDKITSLKAERSKQFVVLSEEDDTSIKKLRNSLLKLRNSKKKKDVSGISMDEFLGASKPLELEYFSVKYQPIILQLSPYKFCLYPSVILVFDINGVFVSALSPEELHIKVEHLSNSIHVQNGSYSSDIIDSDSKCLNVGNTNTTWQYTKVNGGPDLRYSYNPRIEYRVDQMEYGRVKFAIVGIEATYAFSSHAAIEALEEAASLYCIAAERVQNPIPALLGLVKSTVSNKDTVVALQDHYSNMQESQKLYCYISRA